MNRLKRNYVYIIFYICIFAFMYIWFSAIHPLTIYDADDWVYIGYIRRGIPVWKDWNPSRVLPEVLMPLCGSIATYLVMPFTKDYLWSITVVCAIAVSFFVTSYIHSFSQLIKRLFNFNVYFNICITSLFFISHFIVFRSSSTNNTYMFHCVDACCAFYYVIPILLNCTIIMHMMHNSKFEEMVCGGTSGYRGILLLIIYLAIFSNLPASAILAAYSGGVVLLHIWKDGIITKNFQVNTVRKIKIYIGVLVLWLISAIYELSGGRASAGMGYTLSFMQGLRETLHIFQTMVGQLNRTFIAGCVVILLIAALLYAFQEEKSDDFTLCNNMVVLFIALIASIAFTCVLCAEVKADYAYRSDYLYGIFFFAILSISFVLSWVISRFSKMEIFLPIILFILVFDVNTKGSTFLEPNISNVPANTCLAVSNDIIDQITKARDAKETEMVLYVPVHATDDNWPHTKLLEYILIDTLYEHGIIDSWIDITLCPTLEINQKYNLPIPEQRGQ